MSSNKHRSHQSGTTPMTEPQNSPGVAQFSVSEVAQFSVSLDRLLIHTYAGGSRSADQERITVFYGRRGKPVKKPRFIPAELAHQLARKLAGRGLGTVSVL